MRDSYSTIEQLMARQMVRPLLRPCPHDRAIPLPADDRKLSAFRPGLRVVAIEDESGGARMRRWQDEAAGMTIDA